VLTDELLAGNAAPENWVQPEHEAPFLTRWNRNRNILEAF
jgi:hypothetical protein